MKIIKKICYIEPEFFIEIRTEPDDEQMHFDLIELVKKPYPHSMGKTKLKICYCPEIRDDEKEGLTAEGDLFRHRVCGGFIEND